MLIKNKKYIVEIIDFSSSGDGVGKIDGITVFIPHAVPGDIIITEILEYKKRHAKGKIVKIESPSKERIRPVCPHAGTCGGCTYQHVSYKAQTIYKHKRVVDSITRIGGVDNPKIMDVLTMENPCRYRNKAQYKVDMAVTQGSGQANYNVGFFKKSSHEVVNSKTCMLQARTAESVANVVREYVAETKLSIYDVKKGGGLLQGVTVKTAFGTGEVMVILIATEDKIPDIKILTDKIAVGINKINDSRSKGEIKYSFESLILNINNGKENITLAGKATIRDRLNGMDFEISPNSFYQVNPIQTEKLYRKVKSYADLKGNETVLDLYCGVGTIGLLLSRDANRVIGIESVKEAVKDAKRNAAINGIVNAEFFCGKAEEKIQKLINKGLKADVVILNPPRGGCHPQLLDAAASCAPKRIIYVSCNPATLARDIKILTGKGYALREGQPIDMFPYTPHVECVALMSRVEN